MKTVKFVLLFLILSAVLCAEDNTATDKGHASMEENVNGVEDSIQDTEGSVD